MTDIQNDLFLMQDLKYKAFNSKLIPTVDPDTIIGVRTPQLRKYARDLAKTPAAAEFIKQLPHVYFDENNLHGFLIEAEKDFSKALEQTERFLPYVDNWATCDLFFPKVFIKNADALYGSIEKWIKSGKTYTVRYGLGLLLRLYLDEGFRPEFLDLAASAQCDDYYINMMIAWYFATALVKQYDSTIPYLTENRLSVWVHNKAIQKAVESRRISTETKAQLKALKRKDQ